MARRDLRDLKGRGPWAVASEDSTENKDPSVLQSDWIIQKYANLILFMQSLSNFLIFYLLVIL